MTKLTEFLDEAVPDAPPADAPAPEPTPETPPEAAAPPEPEPDAPEGAMVPASALAATRKDWKDKASRAEERERAAIAERDREREELTRLRAELDTAKKAPAVAAPQPQAPAAPVYVPNPVEDPQGYANYSQAMLDDRLWKHTCLVDEAALKRSQDPADVDARIAQFTEAAGKNPALLAELRQQPMPYHWAYDQAKRMEAMAKVGADPEAYVNARIAEARAAWEAETGTAPQAPAPTLPRSLAGAPSAGPRTQSVEPAPEFEDIFKRKR